MDRKPIYAALVAAAFAIPLTAGANDTAKHSKDSKSTSSGYVKGGNDGGAEAMFSSLDKNGDGFLSKDEVKGTPHEADFAMLDKNGDGKISREEHFMAKEHVAARAKAGSTGKTADSSMGKTTDTTPSSSSSLGSSMGSSSSSSSKPSSGTKY